MVIVANYRTTMRYLIYLALIFSTSLFAGSIQKWVDDEGNVHYGDAPPVSAKTKEVRVLGAPSAPGRALPRLSTDSNAKSSSSDDASRVPEDQAKAACEAAQQDLKVISSSTRIKLKSADGSTHYMTTEEIEERRKTSEEDVEKYCN
jgi:hypothetical protein